MLCKKFADGYSNNQFKDRKFKVVASKSRARLNEKQKMQGINQLIKTGILDRPRKLTISPDYFEFENKDFRSDLFTRFEKSEITDYRFGIRWISGYKFTIGREYQIHVRSSDNETVKISFKSFYGLKKELFNKLYSLHNF